MDADKLGPLRLPPQPAKVLALLESRAGEIVSREEICGALWGDDVHVDFEAGLNSCIKQVRAALGDRGVIETLPKRGYRLKRAQRNPAWAWSWRWATAATVMFLCVLCVLVVKGPPRHRPLLAVLPFE